MFKIIVGYKENNYKRKICIILLGVEIALIYAVLLPMINQIFILPILYLDYTIIIYVLIGEKIDYCLFFANISSVLTYIIYCMSIVLSGIIVFIINPEIDYTNPINICIISVIMLCFFSYLGRIKRLKNGIGFLKKKDNISKLSKTINAISLIVFITFISPRKNTENEILYNFIKCSVIALTFCVFYWIKTQITKYYKNNMKDRTIEVQKLEIDEQQRTIEEIKEENLKLADVVHRYNNRLSAVENALEEAINKNTNTEFSNELSVILEETKEISKNFAKESEVVKNKLPKTNIPGIDNMFKYMQKEALENSISFNLKINDSIYDLIDNVIQKDKFETMLGDHLRDAIIAINYSKSTYRSILVTLGLVENCYELSIYDTGIEFEIDILLKLGKERITTHKSSGGSGIGFMTTFDTLSNTKASLRIEEYDSEKSTYTKSVNFRFDGKNEYRIYSYRAEKIKKQNIDKKIIIKEI